MGEVAIAQKGSKQETETTAAIGRDAEFKKLNVPKVLEEAAEKVKTSNKPLQEGTGFKHQRKEAGQLENPKQLQEERATIQAAQHVLAERSYDVGSNKNPRNPDGMLGAKTKAALIAYKRNEMKMSEGEATGELDEKTIKHLLETEKAHHPDALSARRGAISTAIPTKVQDTARELSPSPTNTTAHAVASPPLEGSPVLKPSTVTDAQQEINKLKAMAKEVTANLDKQIKGTGNAIYTAEQTISANNEDRADRSTFDKIIGYIHNDKKEHDLTNEGLKAQARAYQNKKELLVTAQNDLRLAVDKATLLEVQGKTNEALSTLGEATKKAAEIGKIKVDLTESQDKFRQASQAREDTVRSAEKTTNALELTRDASFTIVSSYGAGKVLGLTAKGIQALRAGRVTESAATSASRMLANEEGQVLNAHRNSGGVFEVTNKVPSSAEVTSSAQAAKVATSSRPLYSWNEGPYQMVVSETTLAKGEKVKTAIVNSKEALGYFKKKWTATIQDVSSFEIGEIPPIK